jgi:hypothetical protein
VLTAASKYLVPKMVADADRELCTSLGARSYLRSGPYGIFQKNCRDTQLLTFGHANGTVCLATIVPQLHRLARNGWSEPTQVPQPLFRLDRPLGPLDFCALRISSRGQDDLVSVFDGYRGELQDEPGIGPLFERFGEELRRLRRRAAEQPPRDRTVAAGWQTCRLAGRYTLLLASAACVAVWHHNPALPGPGRALDDTGWLVAALTRLADRLALTALELPDGVLDRVHGELLARHEDLRCFDLTATPLTS